MSSAAATSTSQADPAKRLLAALVEAKRHNLKPPPKLTVSEWADKYRKLSPESSAEPGQWYTGRAEYTRGIMDAFSEPDVHTVVWFASSQVAKTEVINNVCGFFIDQDPAPVLVVQPTLGIAEAWSKDRLAPMLRDTPRLQGKVGDPKSRDSGSTILHRVYPGGSLDISGANSPSSLSSRPKRVVLCDEVDRFPPSAGVEGDPVTLAKKRSTTFWNRILGLFSTGTTKGISRIEEAFKEGDKRRFWVPCPGCGEHQVLKWANVHWDKDGEEHKPETAAYYCEHCGEAWDDGKRWSAVSRGEWCAEAPFNGTASFHIWEAYSSWVRLEETVTAFLDAKGNHERMRVFTNTSLGETFEEKGETVESLPLFERRETYKATVPLGVAILVCAVDVQDDRLEAEVIGYGVGDESWGIRRDVLWGDPSTPALWEDLDEYLEREFTHELGLTIKIAGTCVDSGGHFTLAVYQYCKKRASRRVWAIKGKAGNGRVIVDTPKKNNKAGVRLFTVGTDTAKDMLYAWLKLEKPGPGYCHFPDTYDAEYFNQLTAEQVVTRYKMGRPERVYLLKKGTRNESLDIRVYSMACLKLLNPDLKGRAARMRKKAGVDVAPPVEPPKEPSMNTKITKERRKRVQRRPKRNFATSWRD